MSRKVGRRDFLKATAVAAGSLMLGFRFVPRAHGATAPLGAEWNAWLKISADSQVTVMIPKAEMGQGITTSIPMLIAEELEVPWENIRFDSIVPTATTMRALSAPTSGSRTVREGYEGLRLVGAAAREMLVASAAAQWGVLARACHAEKGEVVHSASGRRLPYGKLAEAAAKLPVPRKPLLKKSADFKLLGKPMQRLDARAKSNGSAIYGIDASVPGMLLAAIRLSSVPGGSVLNLEALKKSAPSGVELLEIPGGLAAVSKTFWSSQSALNALDIKFSGGSTESLNSEFYSRSLHAGLETGGSVFFENGLPPKKKSSAAKTILATYEVPYLAHATMEPLTCLAHVRSGECELWLGTKLPAYHQEVAAEFLGIEKEKVKLHPLFLGGSFGRRGEREFVIQALTLSQKLGKPVKVIWSREEDIQHDTYRPAFAARMRGVVDRGALQSWIAVNSGQSISHLGVRGRHDAHDRNSIDYFQGQPYAMPHRKISTAEVKLPVPVGFWRSTGASHNAFFVECFIDELAAAAGTDPLAFRSRMMPKGSRELAVLNAAAQAAGWRKKTGDGTALGMAFTLIADTMVAQVARVSLEKGALKVHEITCAYDCGPVIDPENAAAQIEGGIIFGLTAALHGKITFQNGQAQQSNFHDYPVVRMGDCPRIKVIRVKSEGKVGGIGEAGVPGVAPAICNAIFSLIGMRIRRLPILEQLTAT